MHKWAKELMEGLKSEVCGIGKDNMTPEQLEEVKCWTEIIKNIAQADKDIKIIDAMEESSSKDNMAMYNKYNEDENRYYTRPRMPRKKMYDDPYYRLDPRDMEREMERDMDIGSRRMYYTEPMAYYTEGGMGGMNGNGNRSMSTGMNASNANMTSNTGHDAREGKAYRSRKTYMDTKEIHAGSTDEDKKARMKDTEMYIADLSEDIMEMYHNASADERQNVKNKLTQLLQKI